MVIELDGSGHYTDEQIGKDAIRTKELEQLDLRVIRVCNIDVDKNFYGVCEFIDKKVKEFV